MNLTSFLKADPFFKTLIFLRDYKDEFVSARVLAKEVGVTYFYFKMNQLRDLSNANLVSVDFSRNDDEFLSRQHLVPHAKISVWGLKYICACESAIKVLEDARSDTPSLVREVMNTDG